MTQKPGPQSELKASSQAPSQSSHQSALSDTCNFYLVKIKIKVDPEVKVRSNPLRS